MARQTGAIKIRGTVGGLCFYRMEGSYYVRSKSSLTSEQFWKGKAFEGSRKSCSRFALGNKIASRLYRMVEEEKRGYRLYCFLKKKAIALLKEGKGKEQVEGLLIGYLEDFGLVERKVPQKVCTPLKKTDQAGLYYNFAVVTTPLSAQRLITLEKGFP